MEPKQEEPVVLFQNDIFICIDLTSEPVERPLYHYVMHSCSCAQLYLNILLRLLINSLWWPDAAKTDGRISSILSQISCICIVSRLLLVNTHTALVFIIQISSTSYKSHKDFKGCRGFLLFTLQAFFNSHTCKEKITFQHWAFLEAKLARIVNQRLQQFTCRHYLRCYLIPIA